MRILCKAQKFAGVNIDERQLCDSVRWLMQNQRVDGALPGFPELVYRRYLVVRNVTYATTSLILSCR